MAGSAKHKVYFKILLSVLFYSFHVLQLVHWYPNENLLHYLNLLRNFIHEQSCVTAVCYISCYAEFSVIFVLLLMNSYNQEK